MLNSACCLVKNFLPWQNHKKYVPYLVLFWKSNLYMSTWRGIILKGNKSSLDVVQSFSDFAFANRALVQVFPCTSLTCMIPNGLLFQDVRYFWTPIFLFLMDCRSVEINVIFVIFRIVRQNFPRILWHSLAFCTWRDSSTGLEYKMLAIHLSTRSSEFQNPVLLSYPIRT